MNTSELLGAPAGTWITVDGWPYVKLADDAHLRIFDCYVDVLRGTIIHGGKLEGNIKQSAPQSVMW